MTNPKSKRRLRKQETENGQRASEEPHFLCCDHDPYPQVPPGEYELYCTEAKPYLDPGMKTWKCRYRFIHPMLRDFPVIYGFINLGKGENPPGPRSRYHHEWSIANNGTPRKRQVMSARIFKGKIFRVRVDWVLPRQHDGKLHTEVTRYSLVKAILALACSGVVEVTK